MELTLALGFLMPFFLGVWEFGYTFYRYAQLENAVRAGARYASLLTYDSASTTPSSAFLTDVQNMTVYGDPQADPSSATPAVPGLTTSNVQLNVTFTNGSPSAMSVAIVGFPLPSYPFGTVTLQGKPYIWYPFQGTWGPP